MIMSTSGENYLMAQDILNLVGPRKFQCAEIEVEYPGFRSHIQKLVLCGILNKYRMVHRGRVNEYQLTPEAISRIKRHTE